MSGALVPTGLRWDAEVWKANVKDQIGWGPVTAGAEAGSCVMVDVITVGVA
jgi:hypothetical protein